ncbi:MAG: ABC transporter substrate-binding protein [Actinomycetota bacterium]
MKHLKQRRGVAWLGLLLAFGLVAVACGDDDTSGTTTATTQATTTTAATTTTEGLPQIAYGGQAIIGDDQEPPTLNAYAPGGDNFIVSKVGQAYWAGVQEIDGYTLELIPELVTELPTVANGGIVVNADGTETIRYQILEEAQWADGTPISGYDFEFTYQTIMDPAYPISRTTYEDIIPESVVAGDKTFEFTLAQPTLIAELIFGLILPKHQVEGTDFMADWNDTMWLSAGPFIFDTWNKGEFIRLVRNDNYWKIDPATGQQLPYLDEVIFRFIPDTTALVNAWKARELDVINPPPDVGQLEELIALEAEGASVEVLGGPVWEHLNFQLGDGRLARNPGSYNEHIEFRRAVAHAIDKDRIVDELLAGQVEPLDSYVEAYSPSLSQGSWAQYDYNPETARGLIAELCAKEGVDCVANPPKAIFSTTTAALRVLLSEVLPDMFADAGILFEAQLEAAPLFFGETTEFGAYDLGDWAWVGTPGFAGLIGIHDVWDPEQAPPLGSNYYRFGSPEYIGEGDFAAYTEGASSVVNENSARMAEIRDAMNATVDEAELVALLNEAETILAEEVFFIPLFTRLDAGVVWADEIGNFKHNPSSAGTEWNIEFWYRADL